MLAGLVVFPSGPAPRHSPPRDRADNHTSTPNGVAHWAWCTRTVGLAHFTSDEWPIRAPDPMGLPLVYDVGLCDLGVALLPAGDRLRVAR